MTAEAASITTYFRVCDGVRVRYADTRAKSDTTLRLRKKRRLRRFDVSREILRTRRFVRQHQRRSELAVAPLETAERGRLYMAGRGSANASGVTPAIAGRFSFRQSTSI